MLFPQVPIEELKKGDTFLDTDGNRWTIVGRLEHAQAVNVESSEAADDPDGGIYTDSLDYGELVRIDQMWRQLTSGRCRSCRVLFVWARRWNVRLRDARCPDCSEPLFHTAPRLLKPGGLVDRAEFRCPLGG